MKVCKVCGSIEFKLKSEEFCSKKCISSYAAKISNKIKTKCDICQKEISLHGIKKHLLKHDEKNEKVPYCCENCGKNVTILFGSGRFCSRVCANTNQHSDGTKLKIKESIEKYNKNNKKDLKLYKYNCPNCDKEFESRKKNRKFCSQSCSSTYYTKITNWGHEAGMKSILSQNRRSKNETYFADLCEKDFNEVLLNEPIFNGWDADIILTEQKLAILWNGNWHHKKISKEHSLDQVQNRDKIKIKEIINFGYEPYVIDDYGRFNKIFVEKEYEKLKEKYIK